MPLKQRWLYFSLISLVLCIPAFYNGFPLLFPDTSGYIIQGFKNEIDVNKPWLYAGFLRHVSLWETLWLVIFVQGIIITTTIHLFFKYFFEEKYRDISFVVYMLLVGATTSLSFHVSVLMPDIFTPIVVLSFCLLLFAKNMTKRDYVLAAFLFMCASGMHNSNFVLGIGLFLLTVFGTLIKTWFPLYQRIGISVGRVVAILGIVVVTYIAICSLNYSKGGEFTATRGGGIFLFARLCDFGISQNYLKENCDKLDYEICKHAHQLNLSGNFLWGSFNNFFNSSGSWSDENKVFYSKLTREILTTPKYLKKYIIYSVESMFMQFFYCGYDPLSHIEGARGIPRLMKSYYPTYYEAAQNCRQITGQYTENQVRLSELVQYLVLGFSGFIFVLLFFDEKYSDLQKGIALVIIFGMLINAFIAGATSGVFDRYQSRIAWLITLPAFWFIYNKISTFLNRRLEIKND